MPTAPDPGALPSVVETVDQFYRQTLDSTPEQDALVAAERLLPASAKLRDAPPKTADRRAQRREGGPAP